MTGWDARWKLATILLACGAVACLQSPAAAATALALSLLLAVAAKITPRQVIGRLALIAVSLVPFIVILPFIESGTLALTIALRALAIGTLALVLLSNPVHRTMAAARSLGVPGPLVQIALLATRYASVFADELRRLRIAWRVRGFHAGCNRATYRTFAHGIGAILVRADDRGERVSAAMRARGYGGRFHTLTPFRSTIPDAVVSVAVVAAFVALAVWERVA